MNELTNEEIIDAVKTMQDLWDKYWYCKQYSSIGLKDIDSKYLDFLTCLDTMSITSGNPHFEYDEDVDLSQYSSYFESNANLANPSIQDLNRYIKQIMLYLELMDNYMSKKIDKLEATAQDHANEFLKEDSNDYKMICDSYLSEIVSNFTNNMHVSGVSKAITSLYPLESTKNFHGEYTYKEYIDNYKKVHDDLVKLKYGIVSKTTKIAKQSPYFPIYEIYHKASIGLYPEIFEEKDGKLIVKEEYLNKDKSNKL